MKIIKNFYLLVVLSCMFSSCISTKKFSYFNDLETTEPIEIVDVVTPVLIQTGDILQVTVATMDKEISNLFNPISTINGNTTNAANQIAQGYLVDEEGNIDLPVIGKVSVKGKTTFQINTAIKSELNKSIKSPFVSTRLLNFRISVLGDVARPGSFNISNERVSILDALSLAGDLNMSAGRQDLKLIREAGGRKKYITINLNDSKTLSSPYFYLTNNDVLYVKPGANKVFSSTRGFQLLPIMLSALSLITVIVTTLK
jgi:polysaccharide biosynthesis/export protein